MEIKSLKIHSGISSEEIDIAMEDGIFNQLVMDDKHLLFLEENKSLLLIVHAIGVKINMEAE
jgi:hypothetical protein